MQFADNAGPDQPAHKRRLIRAFFVRLQNQQILQYMSKNRECSDQTAQIFLLFFFLLFGFYGPFKNISLILSRSFIKGGQPKNPRKNHLTIRKQNLAFPHVTRVRLEPQP